MTTSACRCEPGNRQATASGSHGIRWRDPHSFAGRHRTAAYQASQGQQPIRNEASIMARFEFGHHSRVDPVRVHRAPSGPRPAQLFSGSWNRHLCRRRLPKAAATRCAGSDCQRRVEEDHDGAEEHHRCNRPDVDLIGASAHHRFRGHDGWPRPRLPLPRRSASAIPAVGPTACPDQAGHASRQDDQRIDQHAHPAPRQLPMFVECQAQTEVSTGAKQVFLDPIAVSAQRRRIIMPTKQSSTIARSHYTDAIGSQPASAAGVPWPQQPVQH